MASTEPTMEDRCRALVDTLVLPTPCTLDALVDIVAEHLQVSIDLRAHDFSYDSRLSAMVVRTPDGFAIRYHNSPDPWWVMACVSHEIGHILSDHSSPDSPSPADVPAGTSNLAPHLESLDDAVAAWGRLYRCETHGPMEREAEFIASLLVQRVETNQTSSLSRHLLDSGGLRRAPRPRRREPRTARG